MNDLMKPVQRLGHFWPFFCEVFIVYWKRLRNTSPQVQKNGQKTDINLSYDTNCSMSGFENIISLHNFCVYTV